MNLTPLQMECVRIALQAHAALIQETLAALQPQEKPKETGNGK